MVEQKYLDKHFDNQKSCYNLCPTAASLLGFRHTKKSKKKISNALRGRPIHPNTHKRLLSKDKNPFAKSGKGHPKSGKKMSKRARKTISKKLKKYKKTKEHCFNISEALKGRPLKKETVAKFKDGRRKGTNNAHAKRIAQYNLEGNLIRIWSLMTEAAAKTKISLSSLSSCCHGRNKTAGGFKWKLVDLDLIGYDK